MTFCQRVWHTRIVLRNVAVVVVNGFLPFEFGTIIALDPDIPESVQRVRFVVSPQVAGYRWRLDDEEIGGSDQPMFWVPWPGSHELSLVDRSGTAVDRVRFEVRGALRQSRLQ